MKSIDLVLTIDKIKREGRKVMFEELNRGMMLEDLRRGVVIVDFQKDDGTNREMVCTLDPNELPPESKPKGTGKPTKVNADLIKVWDLEKEGWRSFNLSSLNCYSY